VTELPVDPGEEARRDELIAHQRKQVWKIVGIMVVSFLVGTTILLFILWLVLEKLLPQGI
jgi:uncharacterized membrane protein YdcZ (DUF606 family)